MTGEDRICLYSDLWGDIKNRAEQNIRIYTSQDMRKDTLNLVSQDMRQFTELEQSKT